MPIFDFGGGGNIWLGMVYGVLVYSKYAAFLRWTSLCCNIILVFLSISFFCLYCFPSVVLAYS